MGMMDGGAALEGEQTYMVQLPLRVYGCMLAQMADNNQKLIVPVWHSGAYPPPQVVADTHPH